MSRVQQTTQGTTGAHAAQERGGCRIRRGGHLPLNSIEIHPGNDVLDVACPVHTDYVHIFADQARFWSTGRRTDRDERQNQGVGRCTTRSLEGRGSPESCRGVSLCA
jgi:hypothetical protein